MEKDIRPYNQGEPNPCVILRGKQDIVIDDRPLSGDPGEDDVQVRTMAVGVCGTDVHLYKEGSLGDWEACGSILGHEGSGIITKLGSNVSDFKIGDRVALEGNIGCGKCYKCRMGRYNICYTRMVGQPPTDGCLTKYLNHPASYCHKFSNHVSYEEGALAEPLAVVLHAAKRSNLHTGDSVLICGAGTIGLLSVQVAKAAGAKSITILDLNEQRLDLARHLGADATVCSRGLSPEEVADEIIKKTHKPTLTFECSGASVCLSTAIYAARPLSRIVLIGFGPDVVQVPLVAAMLKEVDILTVTGSANTFQTAVDLISSGKVKCNPMITNRFKLGEIVEALRVVERQECIKSVVVI